MPEAETRSVFRLLLQQLPYSPTAGQEKAMQKLAFFLTDSWKDPTAVFVLKGYAGTGKTSLISALVSVLPHLRRRSCLMAPTGRAAKVLAGYTGRPANTIHRKIYFARTTKEGSIALKLQQNRHKDTLFIVDEASMIQNSSISDFTLFNGRNVLDDLFYFVSTGENCRLLLIGDPAQLPPVGTEHSPALDFGFLKKAYHLTIDSYELTEVVRQEETSGILANATSVRRQINRGDWELPLFDLASRTDTRKIGGPELEEELNNAYSRSGRENNVVICRSNKRANIFNQEIRRRILYLEEEINAGDQMMVVKNNYYWLPEESSAGFIANGDTIELMRIRKIEELYGFRFADVTVRFLDYPEEKELDVKILLNTLTTEAPALPSADSNRLFHEVMKDYEEIPSRRGRIEKVKLNPYFNALQVKFAYALTCHKTQGGQWETVFVDQGFLSEKMMNTEYLRWLYTAITRATKKLYFVNFESRFFLGG
ncbi:MAG TPA: AAA family ATPase [Bacteroidales bacterium]|nr:AAA family ATPase [Bacteroidales bacterium]